MLKKIDKNSNRKARHERVRKKISGTSERPRLCVFRSSNHIYAQIIDDVAGHTLVSASTLDKSADLASTKNKEASKFVGELVAKELQKRGLQK